jgi:signal transduction histidine kinase
MRTSSLNDIVGRAVDLARAQVASAVTDGRHVKLVFEPSDDPVTIPLDPALIEDAVLNLIINAIDAVDGDGQVSVRIAQVEGEYADDSEDALVEVSDTGRGIPTGDLTRIFNPFFTTRPGGTGLGLPAVRRIARAHGGNVEVTSSVGEGSTFTLRLPVIQPH